MTSITIDLPDTIARQVQSRAESQHTTAATVVAAIVTEHLSGQKNYSDARAHYLKRQPVLMQSPHHEYPRRDSLYDRADLR